MRKSDFDLLLECERRSLKKYPHECIGKTTWGRKIYCYYLGNMESEKTILIQGGIHAREYITSFLLFKIMDYMSCFRLPIRLIFIPIMNKDGIEICIKGKSILNRINKRNRLSIISNFTKKYKKIAKIHEKIVKNSEKNTKIIKNYKILLKNMLSRCDSKLFKSNARGVDLNVNFPIDWGEGKNNFFSFPSYQNYVGESPISESEIKALVSITDKLRPNLTLSYHSKGEVFYYGYKGEGREIRKKESRYKRIIKMTTHYKPIFTKNSSGGYKDYCEMKLNIPSFTIEVGDDTLTHPIPKECLDDIFAKNKHLVLELIKEMCRE